MRCSGEAWPQTPLDAHALSGFGPSESAHWPRISLLQVITYMQWLLKNLMTAQLMKLKHKKVVLNTQLQDSLFSLGPGDPCWVFQKADNAIHRINHYTRIAWLVLLTLIHWIAIYPVDSIIQPLNNWGLSMDDR